MTKRNKIIYWVSTLWMSLGMVATGITQLIQGKDVVDNTTQLGYPVYLLTLIGIWKILGVIAVLIPRYPILKEWAYAGFFFTMSGAVFSHVVNGDEATEIFGPTLLLILIVLSWNFRPADRKITLATQ